MQSASQQPINSGDGKPALFPFGAGGGFPATQNPYNVIGAAYYDGQSGTLLERCSDAGCGQNVGWQSWTSRTVQLSAPASGVHRLYLVFTGPATSDFVNVNWFQFAR